MSYDPSKWTSYSSTREEWRNEDDTTKSTEPETYLPASTSYLSGHQLSDETLRAIHIDEGLIETLRSQGLGGNFNDGTEPSAELEASSSGTTQNTEPSKSPEDCMEVELRRTQLLVMTERLTSTVRELPSSQQKKIDESVIVHLAVSLMDGTVYEIVKGLEDIQQLKERNLLNRRSKLLGDQKIERANFTKKYQASLKACGSKPHQTTLVAKQHESEREKFERKLRHELLHLDQKIVLELDQQVSDQQATLQRAGVPLFFVTNNPEDIKLQMTLLGIISSVAE